MPDLLQILTDLSWPVAICIAWLAGEYGQRWTGLPKISFYGIALRSLPRKSACCRNRGPASCWSWPTSRSA
ncbi:hypothetical protein LP419_25195 [Massilia sp. H-1]|nr:hypothetical protein LP419_25195 [Massilia sp. H-1]